MSTPAHELPKETQVTSDPQATDKGGQAKDQREQFLMLLLLLHSARAFPCKPGEKKPLGMWKDDNTEDPARVREFFNDGLNVGLYIGTKVYVIDVEGPKKAVEASRAGLANCAALEARIEALPPTVTVETPSGGRHFYFTLPPGVELRKVDPLLDAIGVEGRTGDHYVVAPGSVVNGVEYRFAEGRSPSDIGVAEFPSAWIEALKAAASPARAPQGDTPQAARNEDERNRDAHWLSVKQGCKFASWAAGMGAKELSEPFWYALLNLMSYCKGGRQLAHDASRPHNGYSPPETNQKFDHASEHNPYTCDYIANSLGFGGCRRCTLRAMEATSPIALGYVVEPLVKQQVQLVFDVDTRRYHNARTGAVLQHQSLSDSLKSQLGKNPHEKLMRSKCTAKVGGTDYRPGDEHLILQSSDEKLLNLWRRGGVTPKAGDASLLHGFYAHLFPDPAAREHILNWLAFLLRRTGRKVKHGLIITGPPGMGKSTLNQIVERLFGEKNTRIVPGEHLGSKFKATLVNKEILIAEEACHGERLEVAEELKELITAETVIVEEKYVSAFKARTPRGMIVTSNWTSPLVVAANDRRWFVAETTKEKASEEYFDKVYAALDDKVTLAAFAADLSSRDLSKFKPDAPPPITAAKVEAIEASRTPLATLFIRAIEDRDPPFQRDIVKLETVEAFATAKKWQFDGLKLSQPRIVSALKEIGCERIDRVRVSGKPMRLWAVRNVEHWRKASQPAVEAEFAKVTILGPPQPDEPAK